MIPKRAMMTMAVMGAGLAAAGLALTGNDLTCPLGKAASGACCPDLQSSASAAECCPVDLTAKRTTAAYQISGLSGEDSGTKLTEVLGKLQGVTESSACTESGLAKVSYDPAAIKKDQLVAAIKTAGFVVEGEVVELKVQGLDCEGCSGTVATALTAVQGVKAQKVSVESKVAVVTFDPVKTSREIIVAAIDKTGFKVVE